jgi:5'-3' exonuclease
MNSAKTKNIIFIDGSYFCFYRFYSTLSWWKNAFPNIELLNPIENEIFVEKFKKTFYDSIKNIALKLNIINPILIVGKDCKRTNIWRNKLYPNYKNTRNNIDFKGGPFFQLVYEQDLFKKAGVKSILYHNQLEADDCIAISTKNILQKYPSSQIIIITSDKDYLQLINPSVKVFNLAFKDISQLKSSTNNAECDLFCKIIMGDSSDNITSVFPKCGPKTALKYFNNKDLFIQQLALHNALDKYNLNKTLIDFQEIPKYLIQEFIQQNIECVEYCLL